ncbi:uncharacterized protein [Diadema antillarum]|uniref:uncharacterized protein n=1 Tax=Diadema antillarum TaxID=105358 RepID=UPI003A87A73E
MIRLFKRDNEHEDLEQEVEDRTPKEVLDIMQRGRQFHPKHRPKVQDIIAQLEKIVSSDGAYQDAHLNISLQITGKSLPTTGSADSSRRVVGTGCSKVSGVTQIDHPSDEVSIDPAELADHFQRLSSKDQPPEDQPPSDQPPIHQTGADGVPHALRGSLPDGESPGGAGGIPPTDPSSLDSDEPIIFNHLSDDDRAFDITVFIQPVFKVQRKIKEGMWTCIDRCHNPNWWSNRHVEQCLHSARVGLDGYGITLVHLKLPSSDSDSPFVLTLRASQGKALTDLKRLCTDGKLCTMLFPCFADEELHKVCGQAKPTIDVELCKDTYAKGMAFFEKLEEKDSKEMDGETKVKSSSAISSTVQSVGDGLHIKTARAELHLNKLPSNVVVGDQYNYYGSSHVTSNSVPRGRHSPASSGRTSRQVQRGAQSQQQCKEAPPKLSDSNEMVSEQLCQDIAKSVPGPKMKSLGRRLGLRDAQVDNIVMDNSQYGGEEAVYQILKTWRGQRASGATKARLAGALWDAGCYDAAREVR